MILLSDTITQLQTSPQAWPPRPVRGRQEVTTDSGRRKLTPEARALLEQQTKVMAEDRAFAKDHPKVAGKLLRVRLSKGKLTEPDSSDQI